MSCTKHFLSLEWEQHSWTRRVTGAELVESPLTTMWGRTVTGESVRCVMQEFCAECGQTRERGYCLCDTAVAERCTLRRAWMKDVH